MAIIFIEGFDLCGSNSELTQKGWAIMEGAVESTGGPFGTFSHSITGNNDTMWFTRAFIRHTTVSFWIKIDATGTVAFALSSTASSASAPTTTTSHFFFTPQADGSVRVGGDGVNFGTSATGVLVVNGTTWHHVECQVDTNVSGNAKVYIDGGLVLDVAGDFTDAAQVNSSIAFNGNIHIDDVVIQEDASTEQPILGEHQISTLLPDANTAQADFTGVFTDIDDPFGSNDGDTTVISSATLTNKSEFGLGNLATSPATVHAVQLVAELNKTDSGTKGATPYIVSNATRSNSPEVIASTTYTYGKGLFVLDPDGSVAWDTASVNALLVGVEVTT